MALAAGTRLGPYEVLSPLGSGAMGEVYRARDTRLGRDVALKVLPASFASDAERLHRFEREARAAGALNHPNILVLHDVGAHDGIPYLVTELLEGETLRERLGGAALPPRKAVDYALQIASGLAAAHGRGLVHRDLKPENIFVLNDGRVKILDFGIAKATRPEDSTAPPGTDEATLSPTASLYTDPGTILGTVAYMSPEQVRAVPVDHRSDIFALGSILYEMLAGRRAFQGASVGETMSAILREDPPDLPSTVSQPLQRIVRHCLEKSPDERFQSASDVAFGLEALSGVATAQEQRSPFAGAAPGWKRRVVPVLACLVVAVAAFLAGQRWADRGAVAPVQYQRLSFRRESIDVARFAADGRSVFYSSLWEIDRSRAYRSDLAHPVAIDVGAPDSSYFLGLSRSNEMALLLRYRPRAHGMAVGTLARMMPGGAPREVLENVTFADWSPEGTKLAVVVSIGTRNRLEYPIGTVLHETSGWITHPRVSPDGESVAFLDHPIYPDDGGSVSLVRAGAPARTLAAGFVSAQGLAWSPDGREIWFSASQAGSRRSIRAVTLSGRLRTVATLPGSACLHDIATRGEGLITNDRVNIGIRGRHAAGEREYTWLDWSVPIAISAGGLLLFSEEGEGAGERYGVCVRGMDGSAPVRLGDGMAQDLSRDGKWVLATRNWTNPPLLELLPVGVGQPRVLAASGLETIFVSQFVPGGDRIVVAGNEPGKPARTYVRRLDEGALRPVTPNGVVMRYGGVSPDGRWVAALVSRGEARLYPIDGGEPREIPGRRPGEIVVGWSRDSRSVYAGVMGGRTVELNRIDLATGRRTRFALITGPEDAAGIPGVIVGRDDHTYAYSYGRVLSELYLAKGMK